MTDTATDEMPGGTTSAKCGRRCYEAMNWHVYMILCSDGSLYTGITTDPERRFRQHAAGCGAKYFRGRQPLRMVYLESGHTRSTAGLRELQIKRMPRADKCRLSSPCGEGGSSRGSGDESQGVKLHASPGELCY
jgi:putative endonuclease